MTFSMKCFRSLLNSNVRLVKGFVPFILLCTLAFLFGCTDKLANPITSIFFGEKGDSLQTSTLGVHLKLSRYSVVKDNNADGIVNPGETVYLLVYLKNTGSDDANNVRATFKTSSSYVSNLSPASYVNCGTISAGTEETANYANVTGNDGSWNDSYSFRFTVSSTTPVGTVIQFTLDIVDGNDSTWADSLSVTVQRTGANIQFSRYTIVLDDNHDGNINPGETGYLLVYLKNTGTSQSNNVKATFTSTSTYVNNISPISPIAFGTISAGGESYGGYDIVTGNDGSWNDYYTFKFTASTRTPTGTLLDFTVNIVDDNGNSWTDSLTVPVK